MNQFQTSPMWQNPVHHLSQENPDVPILYLCPATLQAQAQRFIAHFPGQVTYAVKANPHPAVLSNLIAAGVSGFDVASPNEMAAVRDVGPNAALHYNNPIRSSAEVAAGIANRVFSWSIDDETGLAQLAKVPRSCEVSVRFALPIAGGAYDFGTKFGATPEVAVGLLGQVAALGFKPALCFHPGTQCEDPQAWVAYMTAAQQIAARAGVRLARLNLGGGFAARHYGRPPQLETVLGALAQANHRIFGAKGPALLCEPGRAMVSNAFTLATRIKAMRAGAGEVFLNDGIYGGLMDLRDMGAPQGVEVLSPSGTSRRAARSARQVFGPTCDSLDLLPEGLDLPADTRIGDYLLFAGLGAYSLAMSTRFNGYGLSELVTVGSLAQPKGEEVAGQGRLSR